MYLPPGSIRLDDVCGQLQSNSLPHSDRNQRQAHRWGITDYGHIKSPRNANVATQPRTTPAELDNGTYIVEYTHPDTQPRHLAEADIRKLAYVLAMSSAVYPKQHRWKPMVYGAGYSSGRSLLLADQPKGGAYCPDTIAEHMMWQHWPRLPNTQPTTTADAQLDPIILTAVQSLRDLRKATGKYYENVIRDGMAPVALLVLLQAMGCNAVTAQSIAVRITRQLADNGNSAERVYGDKVIQMLRRSGTLVDRTDGHGTVSGATHCDLCGELAICNPLTTTELSAPVTNDLCQRATEAARHRHTSAATSKRAATAHTTDGVQLCILCIAPHVAQIAAEREYEKTALASQQNRAIPSLRRQHSANSTTWRRMQRADEDPNTVVKQRCSADVVATTVWHMVRQLETTGHIQELTVATTDQGNPAPTNARKRQCTTTSALTPITPTSTGDVPPPIPNATTDPRRRTMNQPRRALFPGAIIAPRNQATTTTANTVDTEQAQPVTTMATANHNNHSAATSCGSLPAGDTTDNDALPSIHAPAPIAIAHTMQSTSAIAPHGTTNNIAADTGRLHSTQNRVTPVTTTGQTTTPTVGVETTMATSYTTARARQIVRIIHGGTTANARLGLMTPVIAAARAKGHDHFVQLLNGRVRDWESILKVAAADKALHQQSALTRTDYKLRITKCSAMLHQAAYAVEQKQRRRPKSVTMAKPPPHDANTTQPSTCQASARLTPPPKRKQQDGAGTSAAADEHCVEMTSPVLTTTDASHQHTLPNTTRALLLEEAARQVTQLQQHSGDAHMMLNVTPDMSTMNWIGTVHRNAAAKQTRLQQLHQRIGALHRDANAREPDFVLMRALHEAMQAIEDALQQLRYKWTQYNRKKKQRH